MKARRLAAKGLDKAGDLAKDTRRLAAEGLDKAQDGLHSAGQATTRAAKAAAIKVRMGHAALVSDILPQVQEVMGWQD